MNAKLASIVVASILSGSGIAHAASLVVDGDLTVTGISTLTGDTTVTSKFNTSKTFTDTTATEYLSRNIVGFNPTSSNGQRTIALYGSARSSSAQNLTRSLGNIGGLHGIDGDVLFSGSGLVTAATAISGTIHITSTGNMTSGVGFMARSPNATSTGRITDAYGLYIFDQKNTAVTGRGFGIFAAGTDNINVLAGATRIGSEADPTSGIALDVTGNFAASGVDNLLPNQTLTGTSSILTRSLGDGLYVSKSGNSTITGDLTATGKLVMNKSFTDISSGQLLADMKAYFNPATANDNRVVTLKSHAVTTANQDLTRSISGGGGICGTEGMAIHSGSGVVTAGVGTSSFVQINSTGEMTNAIAFLARDPDVNSSGLITTAYGLYIEDQKNAGVSGTGYAIYVQGTDNPSVLAGPTRIGGASDPTPGVALDVTGNIAVSENITASGTDNLLPNQTLTGDASILTRQLGDSRYVLQGSSGAWITKAEADTYYQPIGNYALAANVYSKTEADARFLTPAAADTLFLTEAEGDGRYILASQSSNFATVGYVDSTFAAKTYVDTTFLTVADATAYYLTKAEAETSYLPKAPELEVGTDVDASGNNSAALGEETIAQGSHQLVIGRYNIAAGSGTSWVGSDPAFIIGNGDSTTRANAFVVGKDGNMTAFGLNNRLPNQTIVDGKSVLTKELADTLYSTIPPEGDFLTKTVADTYYQPIGNYALAANVYSKTEADARFLTPAAADTLFLTETDGDGRYILASQSSNFATVGYVNSTFSTKTYVDTTFLTVADATAYYLTKAEAETSYLPKAPELEVGTNVDASGDNSVAFGEETIAQGSHQLVIGRYNIAAGSGTTWNPEDPAFVIGNGSSTTRSNAFVVSKNGNLVTFGISNRLPNQTVTDDASILTKELGDSLYAPSAGSGNYLTQAQADGLYQPLGNYMSGGSAYTKLEADGLFALQTSVYPKTEVYTKEEADGLFLTSAEAYLKTEVYTKEEANGKYLTSISGDALFLTQTEGDGRYALIGSGGGSGINPVHVEFGDTTDAAGDYTVSMGSNTVSQGAFQVVLGRYNVPQGDAQNWVETDDLFVIGNGVDADHRNNALVVKKNGNVEVDGDMQVGRVIRVPESGDLSMGEFQ